MHFRIEGPVVAQMQAAFNDNWTKTTGTIVNGTDFFPPLANAGDMDAHLFISSPAGGSESMHLMYLMAIAAAEHSIDLDAAYFIPDDLVTKALIAARLQARAEKNWAESDRIRDQITALGVVLEDGKGGTTWRLAE